MVRKQSLMKNALILVATVAAVLSGCLTVSASEETTTLPENTIFSVGLLFSGKTQENITACPWTLENNDSEKITGPNYGFRDYFSQNLSAELTAYPQITGIHMIEYTSTWNCFTHRSQRNPDNRWTIRDGENVSLFDPYYCHLRLAFDLNQTWDNQLAQDIATMLLTQWYIHRVRIIPDARVTSPSIFGMEQSYLAILLILTLLVRRKKQSK